MVYAVPIQPIRIRRPDYDFFGPIAEGLEAVRERRTADAVGRALSGNDLRGAAQAAFSGGDLRTGLALRQLEAQEAERQAEASRRQAAEAAARDEKAKQYVMGMLATLDPQDPDFNQKWQNHLSRLRAAGYAVPREYDDPQFGYQAALYETLGAKGVLDQRHRERELTLEAAEQFSRDAEARELENYALDSEGVLQPKSMLQPASFRPGDLRPEDRSQPGIIVQYTPPKQGRLSADERRAQTIEQIERKHDIQNDADVPEHIIQRYWTNVYGQKPPSGMKYGRDGSLINMKGATGSQTREAIMGALEASNDAIADVREALRGTSMLGRGVSSMTGSGTYARALGPLRIAIRGVLHGISGAQINIPEQQEYFNTFIPAWNDRESTIEFKLNHLESVLRNIQKATGKGATEADILAVRNEMRRGLGLPPIGPGGSPQQPPPEAIRELLADPSAEAQREFDEVFGEGAAERVLNQRR